MLNCGRAFAIREKCRCNVTCNVRSLYIQNKKCVSVYVSMWVCIKWWMRERPVYVIETWSSAARGGLWCLLPHASFSFLLSAFHTLTIYNTRGPLACHRVSDLVVMCLGRGIRRGTVYTVHEKKLYTTYTHIGTLHKYIYIQTLYTKAITELKWSTL